MDSLAAELWRITMRRQVISSVRGELWPPSRFKKIVLTTSRKSRDLIFSGKLFTISGHIKMPSYCLLSYCVIFQLDYYVTSGTVLVYLSVCSPLELGNSIARVLCVMGWCSFLHRNKSYAHFLVLGRHIAYRELDVYLKTIYLSYVVTQSMRSAEGFLSFRGWCSVTLRGSWGLPCWSSVGYLGSSLPLIWRPFSATVGLPGSVRLLDPGLLRSPRHSPNTYGSTLHRTTLNCCLLVTTRDT